MPQIYRHHIIDTNNIFYIFDRYYLYMNFQQLEYAIAIHKHKHFSIAAESCNVTQATLSAMLKKMEEELKVVLFDRSRKPIKTTDAGEVFVTKAKNIIRERNELYHLYSPSTHLEGEIHLGVIPTVASSLLHIILPTILEENPDLKLHLHEITTDEIKQELMMDKIDLGILATPLNDKQFEEDILYYEPMLLYGIEDSKKKFVSSKDVKDNTVWLLEEGHCFRNQTMTICNLQEKKDKDSNLHFKANSFETLLKLTDEFNGLTLLPELYCQEMSAERKQKIKPFQKPIPVREISLIHYRKHANNLSVDYLVKTIKRLMEGRLSTVDFKSSDLEIVGL